MTYKESKNTFFHPFLGSINKFKAGVHQATARLLLLSEAVICHLQVLVPHQATAKLLLSSGAAWWTLVLDWHRDTDYKVE